MESQNGALKPGRGVYAGLSLIALSTMALEIMLTRIFSVTMWYHFAFLAISVAMFGMSAGAVVVYVKDSLFAQPHLNRRLSSVSAAFGASVPLALILHLYIPFMPIGTEVGVLSVIFTYIILIIPFTLSGIVVSAVLSKYSVAAGKLYFADLVGAAIGCMAVFALMNALDGPNAVIFLGLLALAASLAFLSDEPDDAQTKVQRTRVYAGLFIVGLLLLTNVAWGYIGIYWTKNAVGLPLPENNKTIALERWNPMSRITVDSDGARVPVGWGMSERWFKNPVTVPSRVMLIDNAAGTVLLNFDGDLSKLEFLKDDISALAYHQMPLGGKAAVIGVGGGRDIMTALVFGAGSALGIEINPAILKITNGDFGAFTGHLDKNPKVRFVNEEARSYLAGVNEKFDVVQASLIDSWAATASGAFVLTESGLYTVEGWKTFIGRLTDEGVVTFSRWWVGAQPGEMLRVTNVAARALIESGANNPKDHVFIAARQGPPLPEVGSIGVATIIASKQPLTLERINLLKETCKTMGFDVIQTPIDDLRPDFSSILTPANNAAFVAGYPLDLSASTDDRPFFFNMLSPFKAFEPKVKIQVMTHFNISAVRAVIYLFFALVALAALLIIAPLAFKTGAEAVRDPAATALGSLYFIAIGLGFMLIELGQVQRLSLFLGHPTYSLVIALMGILLFAGAGSYASSGIAKKISASRGFAVFFFALFLAVLALFVLATPSVLKAASAASLPVRMALALVLVAVPGFIMGMPFPIGVAAANAAIPDKIAWLWAVNGCFSVLGSVIALIISIAQGLTFSMSVGVICYAAAIPFVVFRKRA